MNIVGHSDTRRYNPSRDIAYCWPKMVQIACDGLAEDQWDPLFRDYLKQNGVTEAQIGEVVVAYAKYLKSCMDYSDPTAKYPVDILRRVGFFDLPQPAQAALMIKLGQVLTGAFFSSIRDVDMEGEAPPLDDRELMEAARRAREVLAARWAWQRAYHRIRRTALSVRRFFRRG